MNIKSFLLSFVLGFIFIALIILIFGTIFFSKINTRDETKDQRSIDTTPFTAHIDKNYTISYPVNYQIHVDKIIATEGIVEEKQNTIHLISPTLKNSDGNLSIIFSYEPYSTFQDEASLGSTCAQLQGMELEKIQIGENLFTQSGLINCGPNEVAFFYTVNGDNVYEAKVETSAEYESEALPEVLKILKTLRFN